jgi:uncharacterized protein (TIGR03435 family)
MWLIAALAGAAAGQHKGEPPPKLVWTKLKGGCPASLDWASLGGKVVAVWFDPGPFLPGDVTDLNKVARKFQGEPVSFLRVVEGPEFLIDRALEPGASEDCYLLDSDSVNARNFELGSLPATVVINQLGMIAGYSPGDPREQAIRSVLDRRPETGLAEALPHSKPFDPTNGLDDSVSYDVHISPAPQGELQLRALAAGGPDRYITRNQPLKLIILDLWNTPLARIVFPEHLDEGYYDVTAHIPVGDRAVLVQLVKDAVQTHFGLSIGKEERMSTVYLLKALADASSPHLQAAKEDEQWMNGGGEKSIFGTASSMEAIAGYFGSILNVPVIDETGLEDKFNYYVSSKLSGAEAAFDMAHQLGLDLVKAERPIEMLVVSSVK